MRAHKAVGGGGNWYFIYICKLHIRSDKQTASKAFPQLPTGLREISSCLAQQKIWVFWRNFPREDYEKDIFLMVSATDQAENSWCGEIKCVLSKQNFLNLFKGLSLEIATSELQKFLIFGGIFFMQYVPEDNAIDNPKCGRKFASISMDSFVC